MPYFEVDVPTHHTSSDAHGSHVFTGRAADAAQALAAAHAAYDRALLLTLAGREIPSSSSDGWVARGLRPDWVLDWHKAKTKAWVNPNSLI
ncbi:hypothetical protein ACIGW8_31505 [Streptomyces sioyaensis]|uniref:hypothetical protein n=1 Tax=Streptomyces sioyaensis TaxID=67364 RepID=UPI0037D6365C